MGASLRKIAVIVVSMSILNSCSGGQSGSPDNNSSNEFVAEPSTVQRADAIVAAWSQWVDRHQPTQASIAVSYQGRLIAEQGRGRQAATSVPVASLSKAITGVCVAKLVAEGRLAFPDQLQSVTAQLASDVTIESLLTHTSGFRTDVTQNPFGYPGVDQEYLLWVSEQELSSGRDPSNLSYHYNNANYAMLGAAISQITGKTYENACRELVLDPAGVVSARLNPEWRIMSSWGGWELSATDHQKFVSAYFDSDGVLGQSPFVLPNKELGGGAYYGPGFLFREGRNGGYNFWHDGQWHADYNGIAYRFAAFFARWDNGWSVTANHNISAINGEHLELDSLLAAAALQP